MCVGGRGRVWLSTGRGNGWARGGGTGVLFYEVFVAKGLVNSYVIVGLEVNILRFCILSAGGIF